MPPRAAVIEEFDDDTDLPLPSGPALVNTGTRGALLEEIGVDDYAQRAGFDDDDSDDDAPQLIPASSGSGAGRVLPPGAGPGAGMFSQARTTGAQKDLSQYKKWSAFYPLYIDAKRPYGTSQRRIARSKSVWYPLSHDMAEAARRLGLSCLHEQTKCHPADWENPGRIKILLKHDGKPVHPLIHTKRAAIERIAAVIQQMKPDLVPPAVPNEGRERAAAREQENIDNSAAPKSKPKALKGSKQPKERKPGPPRPQPPEKPLTERVSPYSPALESGILIEAVKASMNPSAGQDAAGNPLPAIGGGGGGAGKGKRKVVRVRG